MSTVTPRIKGHSAKAYKAKQVKSEAVRVAPERHSLCKGPENPALKEQQAGVAAQCWMWPELTQAEPGREGP